MPSSTRPASRACTAASSRGSTAPGRFRSLGDGQVDFGAIFSKMAAYDFPGWAVLEWECCLKHPEDGAREGAKFIADHIIRVAERAFDDFAGGGVEHRGEQEDAGHRLRSSAMTIEGSNGGRRAAPHPPGHGGRRPGRVHRRRAPHGGAARRPLRAGGRRAVVRRRARGGERGRAAHRRRAQLRRLPRHGARGGARARDGIDVVAIVTPNHLHGRIATRVPRRRHRRHLRQAADHHAGRGAGAGRARAQQRTPVRADAQLQRLPDGAPGARDGGRRRAGRDPRRAGRVPAGLAQPPTSKPTGQKQAAWRVDPAQAGAGGSLGDIGTHAEHLARFISRPRTGGGQRRPDDLRAPAAASTTTPT